jgi:hypothetical protein
LAVFDGVAAETAGTFSVWEEKHTFSHNLGVYRISGSGQKDMLLWGEVEEDEGQLEIRQIYKKNRMFIVSDLNKQKAAVFCLAFLYQKEIVRGETRLKLMPFSVELENEQFEWLQRQRSLPSLMEIESSLAAFSQTDSGSKKVSFDAAAERIEEPVKVFYDLWGKITRFPRMTDGAYPSFSALVADTGLKATVQLKYMTAATRFIQIEVPVAGYTELGGYNLKLAGVGEQPASLNAWLMLAENGTVSQKSWLEWKEGDRQKRREYNLGLDQLVGLLGLLRTPAKKK